MFLKKLCLILVWAGVCLQAGSVYAQMQPTGFPTAIAKDWDKLARLRKDGLGKDALALLDQMLEKAVVDNNGPELAAILDLYVEVQSESLPEDDIRAQALQDLSEWADAARVPTANLLHNFLADELSHNYYWRYAVESAEFRKEDGRRILFGDSGLDSLVHRHRQLALKDKEALQHISMALYEKTLYPHASVLVEKPTLWDYLAENLLYNERGYASEELASADRPGDNLWFGPSEDFLNNKSTEILQLYQELELFHARQKNTYAQVYWSLQRIAYVSEKMDYLDADKLKTLQSGAYEWLLKRVEAHPAALLVILRQSDLLTEAGNQYDWKSNPGAKDKNAEALQLLENSIKKYNASIYLPQAQDKMRSIRATHVSLEFQHKQSLQEAALLKITYRNFPKAYVTVYHVDRFAEPAGNISNPLFGHALTKVYEQEMLLETNGLYNKHTKDFLLPAWAQTGKYLVLVTSTKDSAAIVTATSKTDERAGKAWLFLDIHAITTVVHSSEGQLRLAVMDSKTGAPISGAVVSLIADQSKVKMVSGKTNVQGMFETTITTPSTWKVVYKGDSLSQFKYFYGDNGPREKVHYTLLTDRGIYRPGQTVYYKLYAYTGDSPDFQVLDKHTAQLELHDINGEKITAAAVRTNERGTFAGSFQLPLSQLALGNMQFVIGDAYINSISVEAYKRPTFEVSSKLDKDDYEFGDDVTVIGKATAFAGYGVSQAKVQLTLTANPGYFRYSNYDSKTILDTVLTTDGTGAFRFTFKADKPWKDAYGAEFTAEITVTSPSGETQSTSISTFIGRSRPDWEVFFPSEVLSSENAKGFVALDIRSKETVKAQPVRLELWRKKQQETAEVFAASEFKDFTSRQWTKAMRDAVYANSDLAEIQYEKIREAEILTGDSIDIRSLVANRAGDYEVKLFLKDTSLQLDAYSVNFSYIRIDTKKDQQGGKFWILPLQVTAQPGEEVSVIVGSSYPKAKVWIEINRDKKIIQQGWYTLKGRKVLKYKMTPEDLGGITISLLAVRDDETTILTRSIDVPFESKKLNIQLETKRDLLRPGSKEKWVLSVQSADGTAADVEMAASMMDASLDAFVSNRWEFWPYAANQNYHRWEYPYYVSQRNGFNVGSRWNDDYTIMLEGSYRGSRKMTLEASMAFDGVSANSYAFSSDSNIAGFISPLAAAVPENKPAAVKMRTNFNETAFFYPQLLAGADHKFQIEFTLPDALTRWKFQALAHDQAMRIGTYLKEIEARKELMIVPNAPRFLRAGDQFEFSANVVNVNDAAQSVTATIEWFDPVTNNSLGNIFGPMPIRQVELAPKGSQTVVWTLHVPSSGIDLAAYRIKVTSGQFSDGEEKAIPILSNRTQVTESVAFVAETKGEYEFELAKLLNQQSTTLENKQLTLEYTSNPVWIAVMSLPYVMSYPYDCAEQTFSKYFANKLSGKILEEHPEIAQVLSAWKTASPEQFLSALQQNESLKAVVLAETPWVLAAKSETQQKQQVAELFALNHLGTQEKESIARLLELQNADGGWPWFAGGKSNLYITQHIVSGFGHLKTMGVAVEEVIDLKSALDYLQSEHTFKFGELSQTARDKKEGLGSLEVQWLYAQSIFRSNDEAAGVYYQSCLKEQWTKLPLQVQALAGSFYKRTGYDAQATLILNSIRNRATTRKQLGTYWNENGSTYYYWDRNNIETQAALIEFYTLMQAPKPEISSMRLWLLNQKRGQYWESTKTTAWACYALLNGAEQVNVTGSAALKIGGQPLAGQTTAGSGYFQQTWYGKEIQPAMGKIAVTQTAEQPGFGSLNWVYTEEMGKITKNTTGLTLQKKVYLVKGSQEIPVTETTVLALGDQIRVRLEVVSDRALEFVHFKDLRAAGMEPVNVLSGYKYEGSLYFYSMNKDAATEFFVDYLPKGKSYLTYDLTVSGKGIQSMGYALVECLYAPAFRANSEGTTIHVK
jgi:uncharacterized protein YfaS (alpha-2-macroglobulin family)